MNKADLDKVLEMQNKFKDGLQSSHVCPVILPVNTNVTIIVECNMGPYPSL